MKSERVCGSHMGDSLFRLWPTAWDTDFSEAVDAAGVWGESDLKLVGLDDRHGCVVEKILHHEGCVGESVDGEVCEGGGIVVVGDDEVADAVKFSCSNVDALGS